MKRIALLVVLAACQSGTDIPETTVIPGPRFVRVRDCVGPATSLDPAIAATLPPRTPQMAQDDRWADLAATIPGGFAGVFFKEGRPILQLTRPDEAVEAKAALAGHVPDFFLQATVRQARWDFAQLVDWDRYLAGVRKPGLTLADKDEVQNRIVYGVLDEQSRTSLARRLDGMRIPCDLVLIKIVAPARTLD